MSEALAQYLGWMAGRRQGNAQIWPDDNPVGTQTVQQMSAATPLGAEIAPGSMPTTRRDGTVPVAGVLTNPLLGPAVQQAAENALMFSPGTIRAYHGSPHKFDRFDPKYIGTGEGAQAYGHGLYFAGNEGVAQSYKSLGYDRATAEIDKIMRAHRGKTLTSGEVSDLLAGTPVDYLRGMPNVLDSIRKLLPEYKPGGAVTGRDLAHYRTIDDGIWSRAGHMYEVDLKVKPEQLLDWDKPIGQQPMPVQQGARRANFPNRLPDEIAELREQARTQGLFSDADRRLLRAEGHNDRRAGDIYQDFANPLGASQRLLNAGVPGIRYLDGTSRAAGQGSHNYVIFDPDLIEIVRRYGIAGLLGGGAVAAQGAPEQ